MRQIIITKKMMWVVIMLLPSLAFTTVKAQDTLVLDIKKALEIALSENPTVKVANKEIQKKKICTERFIFLPISPSKFCCRL